MFNNDEFRKYAVKHRGISSSSLDSYTSITSDYISPTIIEERQLIIKPFDSTVKVPSYLTGCTILGTGQVVPVLVPDNLQILLRENIARQNQNAFKESKQKSHPKANTKTNQQHHKK